MYLIYYNYSIIILSDGMSVPPSEIEFNLTGSYGSPVHTNHNSNYSSMPSPDMDQSERKQQHDQSRRPLSVATDNMMLEFYKKDGYAAKCILLLPTSHSLAFFPPLPLSPSLSPPTPPLRHLILSPHFWSWQHMHIKNPLPCQRICALRNLKFFAPVSQMRPYQKGWNGAVCVHQ